jgi:phage-related protein
METEPHKPLLWVRSSKKALLEFPPSVIQAVGYGLDRIQCGKNHPSAKPLKGLRGGVFELVENYDTDTYRAVYTVHFEKAVYVLHCFQKKSKSGISTPKQEIDLIKQRLKDAEADYKERFK